MQATLGGVLVGALSVFPHDFYVRDGEQVVGILGDISVDREYRGYGVAGAMFEHMVHAEPLRALRGRLVLPNAQAARALGKAGWRHIARVERFVKILRSHARLSQYLGPRLAEKLARPLDLLARRLTYESAYRRGPYEAALVSDLGSAFDELWEGAHKGGMILAVRNARYLRWRFQNHPLTRYRMLGIKNGKDLCGYAMYREANDICFVDDVFCREPAVHAQHVVGLLLDHLRTEGKLGSVSVSVNRGALRLPWWRFGFVRRADFMPVMMSDLNGAASTLSSAAPDCWHITAGDKDV